MAEIPVDRGEGAEGAADGHRDPHDGAGATEEERMGTSDASRAEIEREITKRRMIESITSVVLVVLYMAFSLVRDRDPGVVALDGADDWAE